MSEKSSALDFSRAFQALEHTYSICMQRTLSKYGLYPGQPQLLFAVRSLNRPTQNELATVLCISKASVGVSLRRLESAGFLKRVRDKEDSRCIRILLTKKGEEYARWCDIDFEMIFTTMLEGLTFEQRENTLQQIKRMEKNLDELRTRLEK
jgi:DNA-binding MarR family transcriptional regulator